MYASTYGIRIFVLQTNSKTNNMVILTFYHYPFPFFLLIWRQNCVILLKLLCD